MQPRSEREIFRRVERRQPFNADDVRWILGRAAAEQHRLDRELAGSYSLEELEEMAAEAGISREALRSAIESPPSRFAVLLRRIPGNWSPATKGIALASIAAIALLGVLLAFPMVAYAVLVAALVLLISILLAA